MTCCGKTPWASIVVVNFNAGHLLQSCVDALAAQTMGDFEAIIFDNGSTDASIQTLKLPDDRFRVVTNAANIGFAAANNAACALARGTWLLTINPDTVAEPGCLSALRVATLKHSYASFFGATLVDAGDPQLVDGFGDVLSISGIAWRGGSGSTVAALPDADVEVFGPCAAAALYRRDVFIEAGGFAEEFFCYCEDVDLAFRMQLKGARCVQVRAAVVQHVGSAISGKHSAFTLYHSFRNRIWLIIRNMPGWLLPLSLLVNLTVSAGILWRHRGSGYGGPALRGIVAGLFQCRRALAARREIQRRRMLALRDVSALLAWNLPALRHRPITTLHRERPDLQNYAEPVGSLTA